MRDARQPRCLTADIEDALRPKLKPILQAHDSVVIANLIGSVAIGDMHARSDLDFAVRLRDSSMRVYRGGRLRLAIWLPLDRIDVGEAKWRNAPRRCQGFR